MNINIGHDRLDHFGNASESAPANPFVGQVPEPALDQVEPGTRGGDEVNVEARMFRQPLLREGGGRRGHVFTFYLKELTGSDSQLTASRGSKKHCPRISA